jgi:mannose-1-phosphate guanylyltransferase
VVLVGGLGTRLRPLTFHAPKQMLPVVNRPMIEWSIAHIAAHGVDDVVLSLGYGADAFVSAYPDGVCAGVRLHYAVEDEPLDTAGAVRFAALDAGIDERFLVVNSDVISDMDVTALVAFHEERGAQATIALHEVEDPSRYGVVPTDEYGRVTAFVEKPPAEEAPTNRINAGVYVLEPSVLDHIDGGRRVSIERETFPALIVAGGLFARDDGGAYWLDTGTPEAYLRAQLDIIDGRYQGEGTADANPIDPCAVIADGATVIRSAIGPKAVVDAGAEVSASVVMAGAHIGPGARVCDSIIGPDADVGRGASVEDLSILGENVSIAAGEAVRAARLPEEAP